MTEQQTKKLELIEYSKESLEEYLKTLPQNDPKVDVVKYLIKSLKD
jgi:hypothetical protein